MKPTPEEVALIQAIRRAIGEDTSGPVSVRFTVWDIYELAHKLVRAGVTVNERKAA